MRVRHLFWVAACMAAAACGGQPTGSVSGGGTEVRFDPTHGTLVSVATSGGVMLAAGPGQAENFRLILARPGSTPLTVLGKDQALTSSTVTGNVAALEWNGLLADTGGGRHDIRVRMTVECAERQVTSRLHLENHSGLKIQEVWYPFAPGVDQLARDLALWAPTSTPTERALLPTAGGAGFGYPGHVNLAFLCAQGKSVGKTLYLGIHDTTARYKMLRFVEVGAAPNTGLAACVEHLPFVPDGGAFDGAPVVLRVMDGDWKAAAAVYRAWFDQAFHIVRPSEDWIRRQSFFLMTMFMMPEGTIGYTFKDIPRWARAAKAAGLGAVQVSGWQMGGHDNGYPLYEPDPRLGTMKELEEGIRYCHKLGLKVYFFANYQPVMVEMDRYKTEWQKYREMAADGGYTWMAGWGMGTLWSRAGHPKLMTWMNLAFPQFRKVIVGYFEQLAAIGADGVHVDKMFPSAIDYNPDSPMSPDTATWEGAMQLSKEIMAACRKKNPDWCMSFECNWDRMLQFGGATWWVGNQLVTRKVFPENVETLAISQAYDYLGINNAVRDGHAIMVVPLNFSRGLEWEPARGLARYIREVKAVRDRLQETVFYGEPQGPSDTVLVGAAPDGVQGNLFRNRTTGLRVCVLTNGRNAVRTVEFAGFGNGRSVRVQVPGQPARMMGLPASLNIPAERLAFVEEIPGGTRAPVRPAARPAGAEARSTVPNGGFESGSFEGWTADPNWVVKDNSAGFYSGWSGRYWAWSGGTGEAAVGKLKSRLFTMDRDAVRMLVSGWGSVFGTGKPRHWNYVTLNLEDGTEVDRAWAPDGTTFVPVYLDGTRVRGKRVYVEAVDDADQPSFSMLCIDDVRTADFPAGYAAKLKPVRSDPAGVARLADTRMVVEVSRANGSITRLLDKETGIDLIREPRLAGSWRLALPITGKEPWQTLEANWLFSRDQRLTSCVSQPDSLTLEWDGPLRNYLGEAFDIDVKMKIQLCDGGALFTLDVVNRSPYAVGETYFPTIGGIQGFGATAGALKATEMVRPTGARRTAEGALSDATTSAAIFRVFGNMAPFGDQGPEQFFAYPDSQPYAWVAFREPRSGRAALLGVMDRADRPLFTRLELLPSSAGTARDDGNWPRPAELKGAPAGVELSFVDCKGGQPRAGYTAAPVFLMFRSGTPTQLAEEYRSWREEPHK